MEANWLEMKQIRKRRIADAVWVPLHAVETIRTEGQYGYPGYLDEFFGLGSVAVSLTARDAAKTLSWHEIGIIHDQRIWATKEFYKPAEVYQYNETASLGIELAMIQSLGRAEPAQWHLNQDLVFALGLLRDGDCWVRPSEDYVIVARLRRDAKGEPVAVEIKNEYLRDYLCARGCLLKISWYRARKMIVADPEETGSLKQQQDEMGGERFELRIYPVLEGGGVEGTFEVLHVARTDVDEEEDVPVPGPETNDNVEVKSWRGERKGKTYLMVEGELWRDEEIEPAACSPRVRRDPMPTGISYIVDAQGAKMTSEELDDQDKARWLWFKPSVILELLKHKGTRFDWYTQETGGIGCGPSSLTHFGLNAEGLITVYAYEIAKLDLWQQRIWSGYNVAPEGRVSQELLSAQIRGAPADTKAPERVFGELLSRLDPLFVAATGSPLFRLNAGTGKQHSTVHRFRALEQGGIFALAKDIMRLLADRIDIVPLQKVAPPPPHEKWGSLKSLEKYLATIVAPEEAREITGPLFGAYELRLADAHLAANDLAGSFKLAGIDPQTPSIAQGFSLINNVTRAIWKAGDTVHKYVLNRRKTAELAGSTNDK
jgi:hypothetical protein